MENSMQTMPNVSLTKHLISNRILLAETKSAFIADQSTEQFVKLIALICAMYGIAVPEAIVCKLLHDFITRNFSWVTNEHFRIAFEMNASNQLEKKVEHFSALSVTFIGDVLTLYRPHRDKINLQLQREANEPKQIERVISEQEQIEADEKLMEIIEQHKSDYKTPSKRAYISIWALMAQELLERKGILTHETFSDAIWNKLSITAKRIVMARKEMTNFRLKNLSEESKKEFRELMEFEFKRQAYYEWLKQF